MFIKATRDDIAKYADVFYNIALDSSRSSYPTYTDGIKTKTDFIVKAEKHLEDENSELFLWQQDDEIRGWISFFRIPEDNYFQISGFNIISDTASALNEFIAYIYESEKGCDAYFGFPGDNTEAIECLKSHGFECIERSHNNVLVPVTRRNADAGSAVRITKEAFDDFRMIHSSCDETTYWNCDRVYETFSDWDIFVSYAEGVPAAALFGKTLSSGMAEIFGLEFAGGKYDEKTAEELISAYIDNAAETGAKNLVFICEDEILPAAKHVGLTYVGEYLLYFKKIN